jgi:hypothetical protein
MLYSGEVEEERRYEQKLDLGMTQQQLVFCVGKGAQKWERSGV